MWTTLNEPNQYCMYFNLLFVLSGSVRPDQVDVSRCMHNAVLGHMKAYRLYKERYYEQQQGKARDQADIASDLALEMTSLDNQHLPKNRQPKSIARAPTCLILSSSRLIIDECRKSPRKNTPSLP